MTYTKSGFMLIEILIALVIIGIIASIAVPNIQKLLPGYQRQQFLSRFNGMVHAGWQRALMTGTLHRVVVDIQSSTISLQAATGLAGDKNKEYSTVQESSLSAPTGIPSTIEIKQFFIEGFDEISKFAGDRTAAKVWFFIMPDGGTQEVIINLLDTHEQYGDRPVAVSLVLNPFTTQFKVYDAFQKP